MKHNLFLLFLFFSSCLPLESKTSEYEIVIPLSTKTFLTPVYLGGIQSKNSTMKREDLNTLRDVLIFDLNNNGETTVLLEAGQEETVLASENPFDLEFWKQRGAQFLIIPKIKDKTISVSLFSTKTGIVSEIGPFLFNNSSISNRRIMHKIADHINEILSGKKGIANTSILYALKVPFEGTWRSEIWEMDYDGANKRQVTNEKDYCITPTFFPQEGPFTKNQFLYVNYKQGQAKIYITSFDAPKGTPFISLRGNQLLPSISKSCDKIAFICDASGRADLFVQSFSLEKGLFGKPIQAFSFPKSVQASPTFRPDGKKIAFVSDKEGTPRIFIIDTPSSYTKKAPKPLCITKKHNQNTCPSWSPDGTKLAYSAKIDGIRQIMIYDFMSKETIQLTKGPHNKENPVWAPNSMHIVFNTIGSKTELFLINLKQKEMVQLTEGAGKKHYPSWGPLINS